MEESRPLAQALRLAAALPALCYRGAVAANLWFYRHQLLKVLSLPCLVVGVGNLTTGGTGKTTAAGTIARWLQGRGRRVAILSRGYRGQAERTGAVVSEGAGPLLSAEAAGDEPFLLARQLPGICVLVGKDRRKTGRIALERLGADALVLDDSFQYWRLRKSREILLVDCLSPFGGGRLLPQGRLREPLSGARRAHAIWLTHCDLAGPKATAAIRQVMPRLAPGRPILETIHRPTALRHLEGNGLAPLSLLRGKRLAALSSIGNPAAFELTLAQAGAEVIHPLRFPDHHRYLPAELEELQSRLAGQVDALVTTEKDAVRLPANAFRLPAWVVQVELDVLPGQQSLGQHLAQLLSEELE